MLGRGRIYSIYAYGKLCQHDRLVWISAWVMPMCPPLHVLELFSNLVERHPQFQSTPGVAEIDSKKTNSNLSLTAVTGATYRKILNTGLSGRTFRRMFLRMMAVMTYGQIVIHKSRASQKFRPPLSAHPPPIRGSG